MATYLVVTLRNDKAAFATVFSAGTMTELEAKTAKYAEAGWSRSVVRSRFLSYKEAAVVARAKTASARPLVAA